MLIQNKGRSDNKLRLFHKLLEFLIFQSGSEESGHFTWTPSLWCDEAGFFWVVETPNFQGEKMKKSHQILSFEALIYSVVFPFRKVGSPLEFSRLTTLSVARMQRSAAAPAKQIAEDEAGLAACS